MPAKSYSVVWTELNCFLVSSWLQRPTVHTKRGTQHVASGKCPKRWPGSQTGPTLAQSFTAEYVSKLQLEAEKRKKMMEKHVYCKEKRLWRTGLLYNIKIRNYFRLSMFSKHSPHQNLLKASSISLRTKQCCTCWAKCSEGPSAQRFTRRGVFRMISPGSLIYKRNP